METASFLGSSAEDGKRKIEKNEEGKSGQAAKADSLDGFGEEKRCFGAVGRLVDSVIFGILAVPKAV